MGLRRAALLVLAAAVAATADGCEMFRRARPAAPPALPEIARGTVSAYVRFSSINPIRVMGYGVVNYLRATGSKDMPTSIRDRLLREMRRAGISDAEAILNSGNAAAVLVRGVIQPYHSRGSRFDVEVAALEGTQTTSLEGGVLMRTMLAPPLSDAEGQPPMGAPMAVAHGPMIVRTAADDAAPGPVDLRKGKIIGGGRFGGDRRVVLELNEATNLRMCILIEQAINERFPHAAKKESRQIYSPDAYTVDPTAPPTPGGLPVEAPPRETQYIVELTVPVDYAGRWTHFVQVVANLYLDRTEAGLRRRAEYLIGKLRTPDERLAARFGLEAVGRPALDPLAALLTDPDAAVRANAAMALVALNDARGVPALIEAAGNPAHPQRLEVIDALGHASTPAAIQALQTIAGAPDVDARFAAYESLRRIPGQAVVEHVDKEQRFAIDLVQTDGLRLIVAMAEGDPRLVFFGPDVKLVPPIFFDEGRYWAIAKEGATTLTLMNPKVVSEGPESRPVAPRRPLLNKELDVDLDVLAYVLAMDRLGSNYPDVLKRLREADQLGRMSGHFLLRQTPVGGAFERTLN